jgi:hypothetical protein
MLVFFVGASDLFPAYTSHQPFGITVTKTGAEFIDFASHFNFVKSTLFRPKSTSTSVYSLKNHLEINSEWAGKTINDCALSFGYSPTMMLVLFPLVFFTHSIAYCVFSILSLISVWWQTNPIRSRFGIGIFSFFSSPATSCFYLGQTAILTGAGLLYIYEKTQDTGKSEKWHTPVLPSIALWALTAKPPLAVTAATVLIGMRKWRPVALAVVLTVFTTGIISPLLGEGWWRDYLNMLSHYDKVQGVPEYSWAFHPELMANLRGILSVDLGIADNTASLISSELWIAALIVIASCAPLLKLSSGGLWSLGVLSYLTLCPHVSHTEEIQILLLIPFCVSINDRNLRWQELYLLVVVSLACFLSPLNSILFDNNRMILFSIKIALMMFVGINCRVLGENPQRGAMMISDVFKQ